MCRGLDKHFQGGGVVKFFRWLRFFRDICNYMRYKFKAFLWDVVNLQKNKLGLSLVLGNHYEDLGSYDQYKSMCLTFIYVIHIWCVH